MHYVFKTYNQTIVERKEGGERTRDTTGSGRKTKRGK